MKKKLLGTLLLSVIMCGISIAQELHDAKVNGIVKIGNKYIASVTDLTTNNVYKTSLFEKDLLISNEDVQLDFTSNPTAITGKIIKTGLNVNIFAFLRAEYRMSFSQFKAKASSQGEINFFKQNPVTDNTKFVSEVYDINQGSVIIEPNETLKVLPGRNWFWGDCKYFYGVCAAVLDEQGDFLYKYQTRGVVVLPLPIVGNGLTSDGYLPIGEDVFVKEGLILKKGVYKANYSNQKNGYTVVAIDIVGQ
ncbi:MAG: hypothetical protein H6586_06640 [Flavobacteriales bacterium]|nr:hypothetical protein [Flavobacteriales bacterium]